jgi:hypothetical protein
MSNAYIILIGKLEGKRAFWKLKRGWENDIKIGCEGMDWIHIAESMNTVKIL